MLRILILLGFVVASTASCLGQAGEDEQASPDVSPSLRVAQASNDTPSDSDRAADEQTIRQSAERFVEAYNAGSAETIAGLFLPGGRWFDQQGRDIVGREEIQEELEAVFADNPEAKVEVSVESIRFIGPETALELGSTTMTPAPGETPIRSRYTVLHVKKEGKWQIAAVRDADGPPPSNYERLQPLEWLVGEWVDEGDDSLIRSTCRWSEEKNFLLRQFTIRIEGLDAMEITQRIGWDPLTKRIHSWVFDTEGGHGEGVWVQDGQRWIVKTQFVRRDGVIGSATNEIVPAGPDGFVWRSYDRVLGNDVMPSLEVKIVRRPPSPE